MPRVLRQSIVCQNQEALPDRSSFCGLFSTNNALQKRYFVTLASMNSRSSRLRSPRKIM
ncbi:hypothetical protein L914_16959, partial [Phytophthora nicotianae]